MKKIKLLALFAFLFVFLPHSAKAQVPSFDCSKSIQVYTDVTTGNVYSCKITAGVGTWMLAGGGGGAFGPNFVAGGGTAQAQTVAPTTAVTNVTLVNGYQICWLPVAANTGAAPTLAGSGTSTFSAKPITKYGTVALVANDITTAGIACVIYDGTEFQLQVPLAGGVYSGSISTGSGASAAGATATGGFACVEGPATGWTPTAGQGFIRCDNTLDNYVVSIPLNGATVTPLPVFNAVPVGSKCLQSSGVAGLIVETSAVCSTGNVATGQTNVYGAFLQDFSAATMEIPEAAGFTANTNSTIGLDTTANAVHFLINNADSIAGAFALAPAGTKCVQTSGTKGLLTEAAGVCGSGGTSSGTNLVQVSDGAGAFISNSTIKEDTTNAYIGVSTGALAAPLDIEVTKAVPTSGTTYAMVTENLTTTNTNGASAITVHAVDEIHSFTGQGNAGTQAGHYTSCSDTTTGSVVHSLCGVSRMNSRPGASATSSVATAHYATADFNGSGTTSSLVGFFEDGATILGTGTVTEWSGFRLSAPSTSAGVSLNNVIGMKLVDLSGVSHQSGSGCLVDLLFGGGCGGRTDAWSILDFNSNPSALFSLSIGKTSPPTGALDVVGAGRVSTSMSAATYVSATNCKANGTAANPSVVSCGSAAAGMFSCATNASTGTCQVNTTAVTANSEIFITQDQADGGAGQLNVTCNTGLDLAAAAPLLNAKAAGASFTINLGTVTANPACFEYFIVN